MQEDNSKIEITLLKVITYGLQTYLVGMEAWIVHAYKLLLGLVRIGEFVLESFSQIGSSIHVLKALN